MSIRGWTLLSFSGFSLPDISSVIYGCSDCEGEEAAVVELSRTLTLLQSSILSGSGH